MIYRDIGFENVEGLPTEEAYKLFTSYVQAGQMEAAFLLEIHVGCHFLEIAGYDRRWRSQVLTLVRQGPEKAEFCAETTGGSLFS